MKFKVVIDKLKKGWQLVLPVSSDRVGRALIVELNDRIARAEPDAKKVAKFKGALKKNGKSSVVVLYRSKLSQVQELVKESFLKEHRASR